MYYFFLDKYKHQCTVLHKRGNYLPNCWCMLYHIDSWIFALRLSYPSIYTSNQRSNLC